MVISYGAKIGRHILHLDHSSGRHLDPQNLQPLTSRLLARYS